MTATKKLRAGVGAVAETLLKYIHPSKLIRDKYPNPINGQRLENCLLIRRETKEVNRKQQVCVIFRHDEFPDKELHAVERWVKVKKEGAEEHLFDKDQPRDESGDEPEVEDGQELQPSIFRATGVAEDIAMVRAQGLDVDDDNEPAPENVPTGETTRTRQANGIYEGQQFGWDGVDHRARAGHHDLPATMLGMPDVNFVSHIQMFLLFFPRVLIDLVITESNKAHSELHLTFGEFLRFLGLKLFMATCANYNRREFWSSNPINEFGAPYRFNDYMSWRRFETIMKCLTFTSRKPPPYKDRFWEVREMISVWNKYMLQHFKPSWVSCLDKSMSIWYNRYTCPSWMFMPRKPHPFGNEYHTIGCGLSTIMFAIELMEGKDRPKELPSEGGTAGLLLRLCKCLCGTGKVVVLDSGFCVLAALIALKNVGIYATAVIKKRRYWPRYVAGDVIDDHMKEKKIGETSSVRGILDRIPYNIFAMKEPDYIMKLMSTYGSLVVKGNVKNNVRIVDGVKHVFQYQEPFSNHFLYRHVVDDHNNHRHSHPSIEETWVTHRWPIRVFSFILAISEVNTWLAFRYFVWGPQKIAKFPTIHNFRRRLAMNLINNRWIVESAEQRSSRKRKLETHSFCTAPPHAKNFCSGNWDVSAKSKYQQYHCKTNQCSKQVRSYCSCRVGHWMCQSCHQCHVVECVTSESASD